MPHHPVAVRSAHLLQCSLWLPGFARSARDLEALEGALIAGHVQGSNGCRQHQSGSTTNDLLMCLPSLAEYNLPDQP
jgi:hypothetical protein